MSQLAWNTTPFPSILSRWARSRRDRSTADHPLLARGERILTVADTLDGSAAASTHALYHRHDDQPDQWVRIGWEDIETARWRPAELALSLTAPPGSEPLTITLQLTETGRLPAICRDRITATIIATRRLTVASSPALITIRRQPGTDTLLWTVRLRDHPGVDTDKHVDRAIRELRADLGI